MAATGSFSSARALAPPPPENFWQIRMPVSFYRHLVPTLSTLLLNHDRLDSVHRESYMAAIPFHRSTGGALVRAPFCRFQGSHQSAALMGGGAGQRFEMGRSGAR
jgi:hypothetical protein